MILLVNIWAQIIAYILIQKKAQKAGRATATAQKEKESMPPGKESAQTGSRIQWRGMLK